MKIRIHADFHLGVSLCKTPPEAVETAASLPREMA